jgi:peptide deformylase
MVAHVQGVDVNGAEVEYTGSGLLGRCLQHETDHLKGRLFIQTHVPRVQREVESQIQAADWFGLDSIEPA